MNSGNIIVYQAPKADPKSKVAKNIAAKASDIVILISLLLLLLGLVPIIKSRINYSKSIKNQIKFADLIKNSPSGIIISFPDPNFSLVIPKINLSEKILADVDISSQKTYSRALREGVAHAKGTVFPGMPGAIYLFAHSSIPPWEVLKSSPKFALLNELQPSDSLFVSYNGKKFNYQVVDKKIVAFKETNYLYSDKETLILQTCYPVGTTENALLVFAKRIAS